MNTKAANNGGATTSALAHATIVSEDVLKSVTGGINEIPHPWPPTRPDEPDPIIICQVP